MRWIVMTLYLMMGIPNPIPPQKGMNQGSGDGNDECRDEERVDKDGFKSEEKYISITIVPSSKDVQARSIGEFHHPSLLEILADESVTSAGPLEGYAGGC
jgi:hypothetical protein